MNKVSIEKYKQINEMFFLTLFCFYFRNIVTTSFRDTANDHSDLAECPICCDSIRSDQLKQMPCCSTRLCSSCLITHTITNIRNAKAKIECPACSQDINSSTILYNSELPVSIRERYQEILAQDLADKQNTYIKLCPHCNFITILDENDPKTNRKKSRRASNEWITCDQCTKEWCWSCYAPAHPNETCREFKKSHTQLDMWAKSRRMDNQQRNAQRCPKCSIYIEKIDGCDHMICSKCKSKFCYRCGSRMRLPVYIGHDAKYSIFGCKYKLFPDRPLLRWLVRGSIFTGILILSPIVLAAVIALVAIGIPITLVIACFALPIYACTACSKRS
jgi:E3 ubiquitin-protein ligase RNF217